jgi:hypothetical protein
VDQPVIGSWYVQAGDGSSAPWWAIVHCDNDGMGQMQYFPALTRPQAARIARQQSVRIIAAGGPVAS